MTSQDTIARLRAEVAEHKRLIRFHRKKLQATSANLAALEQECSRRGIAFSVVDNSKRATRTET